MIKTFAFLLLFLLFPSILIAEDNSDRFERMYKQLSESGLLKLKDAFPYRALRKEFIGKPYPDEESVQKAIKRVAPEAYEEPTEDDIKRLSTYAKLVISDLFDEGKFENSF